MSDGARVHPSALPPGGAHARITGPAHVSHRRMSNATRNPDASDVFPHGPGTPTYQPRERFWPVRRPAGTADAGGTGGARSRPARGPVRRAAAAVLLHAGVPAVRGLRLRACGRPGASVGRVPRGGYRRQLPSPRPLLPAGCRCAQGPVRDRRPLRRYGGARRRSTGAVRARAVAAAALDADLARARRGTWLTKSRWDGCRGREG